MPTGYTEMLERNPKVTFPEFLWRCARAFGAFVHQRDESLSVPCYVQPEPEGVSWRQKNLDKAKLELEQFLSMRPSEWAAMAVEQHAAATQAYLREEADKAQRRSVYLRMEAEVRAWTPPTPGHKGLKDFMLQQLGTETPYLTSRRDPPKLVPWDELRDSSIAYAREDIRRNTEALAEARQQQANVVEWVEALRKAVPQP